MAEEIDFENGRFGNFQGPVTLDPVKFYIVFTPEFRPNRTIISFGPLRRGLGQVQGQVTRKLGQISKIWLRQI